MRREHGNAHLDDGRRRDRRGDDIVRSRRHAHAEHDGRDHREKECRQQQAARKREQAGRELEPDARLRDDADDNACRGAGHEHGKHVARALVKAAHDLDGLHARRFPKRRADDGKHDGDERRAHRRIA